MLKSFKKIAIYGGTFDPPHNKHYDLVQAALQQFDFDKIIIVPCALSPFKDHLPTSGEDRIEMLRLLFQGEKKIEISSFEIDRRDEKSYSYITAEHFHGLHPEAKLYWIVGSDQWKDIDQWKNLPRLKELLTFIVVPRPNIPEVKTDIPFFPLRMEPGNISATMIRSLRKKGEPISRFVAPPIENYIQQKKLYTK